MYQFQKKSGEVVDFDQTKIAIGVQKAGGTPENAQQVITSVEAWLPTAAVGNVVNALDVRNKVIEELRVVNPTVAASFESYQKP